MKKTILKTAVTVLGSAAAAYFGALAVPLLVLLCAMLLDYATGMAKAYITAQLSSRIGLRGILKKLCCMAMVAVGAAVDYLLESALASAGIELGTGLFCGMLVAVWLIVNELISILENLAAIGVPGFPALEKLLRRLRSAIDNEAKTGKAKETENEEEHENDA